MAAQYGEQAVSRVIDALYAAALTPEGWMPVLWQMRSLFEAGSAALVIHNADRSRAEGRTAGMDPEDHQRQLRNGFRTSPTYSQRLRLAASGQIDRVAELVPRAVFIRSQMYQGFWRRYGMEDGVALTISVDRSGTHHAINMLRPASSGAFEPRDVEMARRLMPHLQHTVAVQRRIGHAAASAASAFASFDLLRQAVLLLDEEGRLLHASASAEVLLLAGNGLRAREGVFYAASASVTARLHAILAAAAGRHGAPARAGSLRLPKPSGGSPLLLVAMPLRQETHWSLSRRAGVLVCVTDPDATAAVSGRLMMDLFGLTGAEAALAGDLLAGKDLSAIARERDRSINTIRSQLARVMAKTGVNRQSELVRLLTSLPALNDPK